MILPGKGIVTYISAVLFHLVVGTKNKIFELRISTPEHFCFVYVIEEFCKLFIQPGLLFYCHLLYLITRVSLWLRGKEYICLQCRRCRRCGFDPWVGKIPFKRKWQLQYSCLGNSMDRGACWAVVRRVSKSQTWLSTHAHAHTHTSSHIHTHLINFLYWSFDVVILETKIILFLPQLKEENKNDPLAHYSRKTTCF